MADIIIVAVIAAALGGIFWKQAKDHKSGKGGCGCGCSGCQGCASQGGCSRFSVDEGQKKECI